MVKCNCYNIATYLLLLIAQIGIFIACNIQQYKKGFIWPPFSIIQLCDVKIV